MSLKHITKHIPGDDFTEVVDFKQQSKGSGREAGRKIRKKMAHSAKRKENESWKRNIEY